MMKITIILLTLLLNTGLVFGQTYKVKDTAQERAMATLGRKLTAEELKIQEYVKGLLFENKNVQTLHLFIVASTLDFRIGASTRIDKNNLIISITDICKKIDIRLSKIIIDGQNFSKSKLSHAIEYLNPSADDIVFFVYTGHGYCNRYQDGDFPFLDLRKSNFTKRTNSNCYNLSQIYHDIVSKGARLNIIIGDCCSSYIGNTRDVSQNNLVASKDQSVISCNNLKKLFSLSKGNYLIAAAQPGETSCGNSNSGGYLISSFLYSLQNESDDYDSPSWIQVIKQSIVLARERTRNLIDCNIQNGLYYTNLN